MKRALGPSLFVILLGYFAVGPFWKVSAQTTHSITIAWTETNNSDPAAGFNVLRGPTGGPYTKLNTSLLPLTPTTYVDTTGVAGTNYCYVVNAQDAAGNLSANSAQACATMLGNPQTPQGVTATAQ